MKRIRRIGLIIYGILCIAIALIHFDLIVRIYLRMPIENETTRILSLIHPLYTPASLLFAVASGLGVWGALRLRPTSRNEVERTLSPITFTLFTFFTLPVFSAFLILKNQYPMLEKFYLVFLFMALSFYVVTGIFQMGMNTSRIRRFYVLIPLLAVWIATLAPVFSSQSTGLLFTRLPAIIIALIAALSIISMITYWGLYLTNRSRFTLIRALRTTCVLIGAFIFVSRMNTPSALAGASIYTIGTSLGFYRGRSELL